MTIQSVCFCGALCVLAAAGAAHAAPANEPAPARITLPELHASLGQSLQAWRATPPPPGLAGYQGVCRSETWKPPSPLLGAAPQAVTACDYEKTLGAVKIRPSIRLEPGDYRVRQVTWRFRGGRLAAVSANMSGDAYDAVVRALNKTYGPALDTIRRTASTRDGPLPQVVMAWRKGDRLATVTDPAPPRWNLQVVIAEAPLGASRSAQAGAPPKA